MELITENWSLFLSPKGNNSGDLGKPLNDNFEKIDKALFDIRTNFVNNPQVDIPLGGFSFSDDTLFIKTTTGLTVLGGLGSGAGSGFTFNTASLLASLSRSITQDQLSFELGSRIDLIDANIASAVAAKDLAVQAKIDAVSAAGSAVSAANAAEGYKNDTTNIYNSTYTLAGNVSAAASTVASNASAAASSAGAAGQSATLANDYKIAAGISAANASGAVNAVSADKSIVFGYKTAAETAAGTANTHATNAGISATNASGYAQSAFQYKESSLAYSNQSQSSAIASQSASGLAENAAGRSQSSSILSIQASGLAQSAFQAAQLQSESASGFSQQAYLYSLDSSGYAQEARAKAELSAISAQEASGYVITESIARANADSALSSSITQLTTSVNGNTSTIQTHASSINGLEAQYSIKINNNGTISGFGLSSIPSSGAPTSEFAVLADKFRISKSGQTPSQSTQMFLVDGTSGDISLNGNVKITGNVTITSGPTYEQIKTLSNTIPITGSQYELFKFDKNITGSRGTSPIASTFQRVNGMSLFGDSCIATEEATINILNTDWTQWTSYASVGETGTLTYRDDPVYGRVLKISKTSNGVGRFGIVTTVFGFNAGYTTSCYFRSLTNIPVAAYVMYMAVHTADGIGWALTDSEIWLNSIEKDVWTRKISVVNQGPLQSSGDAYIWIDTGGPCEIEVALPQIENKLYATSQVTGSRAHGFLKYPGFEQKVNWKNFGFVGWIKCSSVNDPRYKGIFGSFTGTGDGICLYIMPTKELAFSWFAAPGEQRTKVTTALVDDFDWQMIGINTDFENRWVELSLNGVTERYTLEEGLYTMPGVGTNFVIGLLGLVYTSDPANMLMSNFLFKKEGVFTPEEVLAYYQCRAPFYDTQSIVDVPEPLTVSAPTFT